LYLLIFFLKGYCAGYKIRDIGKNTVDHRKMVETVNTLSVSNAPARSAPQAAAVLSGQADVSAPDTSSVDFVASRIRVDNLQNVAILEYRSGRTGEVVRQYPTQVQIQAFHQAEHIRETVRQQHAALAPATTTPSEGSDSLHIAASSASVPVSTPASAATPSVPAPPVPTIEAGHPASNSGSSPHSVLV
jgi:hypothetical protein